LSSFPPEGFSIEPYDSHERGEFTCGVAPLDHYCKSLMSQDVKRNLAAPYILVGQGSGAVQGFYTLSCASVPARDLPDSLKLKVGYSDAPAILLGRLAVAVNHQKKGFGSLLLLDALRKSLRLSQKICSLGVIVDAKDETAKRFYEHHDFLGFKDDKRRLFIGMKTVGKLFPSA